jgi:quercetin dioxygenase-like cupin family protein
MQIPSGRDAGTARHEGVSMKVIVDKSTGSQSMWVGIGQFAAGGEVDIHTHEHSEHCYYILKGEIIVTDNVGRHRITEGMGCWIAMNEPHGMVNESNETAVYFVVSAPSSI